MKSECGMAGESRWVGGQKSRQELDQGSPCRYNWSAGTRSCCQHSGHRSSKSTHRHINHPPYIRACCTSHICRFIMICGLYIFIPFPRYDCVWLLWNRTLNHCLPSIFLHIFLFVSNENNILGCLLNNLYHLDKMVFYCLMPYKNVKNCKFGHSYTFSDNFITNNYFSPFSQLICLCYVYHLQEK